MSWTDPCGNCGNHRADCDYKDGYNSARTNDTNTEDRKLTIPDVSNLAKFCQKIAKQEDCSPEFIEIVDKEFWNLI